MTGFEPRTSGIGSDRSTNSTRFVGDNLTNLIVWVVEAEVAILAQEQAVVILTRGLGSHLQHWRHGNWIFR